jgi:hypothetical protein
MKNLQTPSIVELKEEAANKIKAYMESVYVQHDGHAMELLANLLFNKETYDESKPYDFINICLETLALLSDPAISKRLPSYLRPTIGQDLIKLYEFFDAIHDPACQAAFALYSVQNCDPKERDLQSYIRRYSQELKERGGAK